jgi:hypothetical protein
MKTPREIYAQYKIMPNLQLHQLRVAAVGKMVCDNFKEPVNTGDVILACLFHDMGNILKFDLTYFPEAVEPQGLTYWEGVKKEYREKYGEDQHEASQTIAGEIGLSGTVVRLIGLVSFSGLRETLKEPAREPKIVEYGDCRVAPYGIAPIRERFIDGRKRYLHRFPTQEENDAHYDALTEAGYEIERQIFAHCSITPQEITDASVAPLIEELWEYPVNA